MCTILPKGYEQGPAADYVRFFQRTTYDARSVVSVGLTLVWPNTGATAYREGSV